MLCARAQVDAWCVVFTQRRLLIDFRGKLNAVIGDDVVSVELCDFGNLVLLPLESVRELPHSFRTLPRQALRASLAGKLCFVW